MGKYRPSDAGKRQRRKTLSRSRGGYAERSLYNPITGNIIQNTSRNRNSIRRQIANYQRNKLVLIACSKTKAFTGDEKIRAGDAYCSPLFQKSKRWAESRGLDYAIISAKYGLIWPNEQIKDYDLMLPELRPLDLIAWKEQVADDIHRWRLRKGQSDVKVIALAGKSYTEPLESSLRQSSLGHGATIEFEEPLEGLQVGQRLSRLNKENEVWKNWNDFSHWNPMPRDMR